MFVLVVSRLFFNECLSRMCVICCRVTSVYFFAGGGYSFCRAVRLGRWGICFFAWLLQCAPGIGGRVRGCDLSRRRCCDGSQSVVLPASSPSPLTFNSWVNQSFVPRRKLPQTRVSHHALLDACASWWTHGAGHGNPGMALAVAEAAGRYGHVIFPGNIHAPALEARRQLRCSSFVDVSKVGARCACVMSN